MTPGVSSGMLLYNVVGSGLSGPVNLTLPNTAGLQPGSTVFLGLFNPITGGHDAAGELVVSADGQTMTSTGPIALFGPDESANSNSSPAATPNVASRSAASGGPTRAWSVPTYSAGFGLSIHLVFQSNGFAGLTVCRLPARATERPLRLMLRRRGLGLRRRAQCRRPARRRRRPLPPLRRKRL